MAKVKPFKKTNWCVTETSTEMIPFKWTIKNFSFHAREVGYSLKSSTFASQNEDKTEWYLEIYPVGKLKDDENFVAIYLSALVNEKNDIFAKFKIAVINNISGLNNEAKSSCVRKFGPKSISWGWMKFIKTDILLRDDNGFLPKDTLTIQCEVDVLVESFNTSGKLVSTPTPSCSELDDDLLCLLKNELFSDVTLSVQKNQYKVHKNILAARSPVFATMFSTDMKEKNQDVVEIRDIDVNVFSNMLNFIYTGNAPDFVSVKQTRNLLIAANRFLINGLKKNCEDNLCQNITVNTVLNLLQLADTHSADDLKAVALDFIHCHISAVTKTKSWITMRRKHPNLLHEALEYNLQQDQMKR